MGKLRLTLLALLFLGCASVAPEPKPQTSDEWATYCMRLAEDPRPDRRELFEACLQDWKAWSSEQRLKAR